jgi:hypothetical protein
MENARTSHEDVGAVLVLVMPGSALFTADGASQLLLVDPLNFTDDAACRCIS